MIATHDAISRIAGTLPSLIAGLSGLNGGSAFVRPLEGFLHVRSK
jgi:hypothetical protein